ncbi:MAG: MerR family transcriptional regulator, partial [Actinomycetota bacterium]|nr:MerR family transcriptional regulator [Actinomycetota bacterium]
RSMTGLTEQELTELESFGIISPRRPSSNTYVEQEVAIGAASRVLLRYGIDARHLRNWRTSAERELSLMEQLLAHQLRQRDPSMRRKTNEQSAEIAEAGGKLRAALVQEGLQRLFD